MLALVAVMRERDGCCGQKHDGEDGEEGFHSVPLPGYVTAADAGEQPNCVQETIL